jgi:hypothetical protein
MMLAVTPVPIIPWTAWLILIPIQIVLDAGLFWGTWWAVMNHDPNRMTPKARLLLAWTWMAAMVVFTFGTLIITVVTLNPTHDPRIGMVGMYYFGAAAIPPMIVVCWIIWRAGYRWYWSPEAKARLAQKR